MHDTISELLGWFMAAEVAEHIAKMLRLQHNILTLTAVGPARCILFLLEDKHVPDVLDILAKHTLPVADTHVLAGFTFSVISAYPVKGSNLVILAALLRSPEQEKTMN